MRLEVNVGSGTITFLVLTILLQELPSPRQVYLVHDGDSREARMMLAEINRDWGKFGLEELDRYAKVVKTEVIVERNGDRLKRGVFYRVGLRGELRSVDARAFNDTGRAVTSLYIYHYNSTLDLRNWKTECEQIEKEAQSEHLRAVQSWLEVAAPDILKRLTRETPDWGLAENFMWLRVNKELGNFTGFPEYVRPTLPPVPLLPLPWE